MKNLCKLVQTDRRWCTKVDAGTKQRHRNCEEDFDCRFANKMTRNSGSMMFVSISLFISPKEITLLIKWTQGRFNIIWKQNMHFKINPYHWDQKDTHREPRWRQRCFFYYKGTVNKVKEWTNVAILSGGPVVWGCPTERTSTLVCHFHLAS